ncbi:MAG: ferritin-like domain-containing protein [Nitrospirae bacterium]|nr:ferritin-like domain-containing protein [Nitrospirota bacterium]
MIEDSLYPALFRRLEKSRWELSEVPFDRVETARVSDEVLDFIRVNALMELSSLYATRMFLRDFRDNPDLCQFMSIWYYEEMKHYLVLREYLKVFGREPREEDLPSLDTELDPAPWAPTLAMHYCGELRLGMWYYRWSELFEEPVLRMIYRLIGNDEYRHAQCYEEFMRQAIRRDPGVLYDFLQMAKWMMVNPDGDKHPTTVRVNGPDRPSVTDRIPGYGIFRERVTQDLSPEDEGELQKRILVTFYRLSGREIKNLPDLSAYTRDLRETKQRGCHVVSG